MRQKFPPWILKFCFKVKTIFHDANMFSASEPFHSPEWPRQSFSLQYQYNVNQISDENKEKYKKNINLGIMSWSNTNFSEQTQELYGWHLGEVQIWSELNDERYRGILVGQKFPPWILKFPFKLKTIFHDANMFSSS